MNLRIWLLKNKILIKDFAEILGYTYPYLCKVIAQKRRPSFQLARSIEKETAGEIRAFDLMSEIYENDSSLKK